MTRLLFPLLLLLSAPFASAHDHDDHDDFPEGTLLALEGRDAVTGKDCALFVMDLGTLNGGFYAKVVTNYSHGSQHPEEILVGVSPDRPGVLAGTGSNGEDRIAIFLGSSDEPDLRTARSFNLRWWHVNHAHTYRCVDLKVHDHDHDEH